MCVEAFKEFYEVDAKHRKLSWVYTQGTAVLRGNFKARPIEMVLSTLQAALLLLYNGADDLSFADVCERLHLGDDDVSRLLHSLSCAKYKILNKEPAGRSIARTDRFSFNDSFTDRLKRIKV